MLNPVSRTNTLIAQASELLGLFSVASKNSQAALSNAFVLQVEQVLLALVLEVSESNETPLNFLPYLVENESNHWLVKQLKERLQHDDTWLGEWWLKRNEVLKLNLAQANSSQMIVSHRESSDEQLYKVWLNELNTLIGEYRELNSHY